MKRIICVSALAVIILLAGFSSVVSAHVPDSSVLLKIKTTLPNNILNIRNDFEEISDIPLFKNNVIKNDRVPGSILFNFLRAWILFISFVFSEWMNLTMNGNWEPGLFFSIIGSLWFYTFLVLFGWMFGGG